MLQHKWEDDTNTRPSCLGLCRQPHHTITCDHTWELLVTISIDVFSTLINHRKLKNPILSLPVSVGPKINGALNFLHRVLSLYLRLSRSLPLSLWVSVSLSISSPLSLFLSLSISHCLSLCSVSLYQPVSCLILSLYIYICLSLSMSSLSLSLHQPSSISLLFIYPFIDLFFNQLSIYLSI